MNAFLPTFLRVLKGRAVDSLGCRKESKFWVQGQLFQGLGLLGAVFVASLVAQGHVVLAFHQPRQL